jgi:hypothetical protein
VSRSEFARTRKSLSEDAFKSANVCALTSNLVMTEGESRQPQEAWRTGMLTASPTACCQHRQHSSCCVSKPATVRASEKINCAKTGTLCGLQVYVGGRLQQSQPIVLSRGHALRALGYPQIYRSPFGQKNLKLSQSL